MSKPTRKVSTILPQSQALHVSFVADVTGTRYAKAQRRRSKKRNRRTGTSHKPGFNQPLFLNELFVDPSLKIHAEGIGFLFRITGASQSLLWFLLLFKHDIGTGTYRFNKIITSEFQDYCLRHFDQEYSEQTIQQAHRNLVNANISCNVKTGTYMINPLLSGGSNADARARLSGEYTDLLRSKRKDLSDNFYPVYKKKKPANWDSPVDTLI